MKKTEPAKRLTKTTWSTWNQGATYVDSRRAMLLSSSDIQTKNCRSSSMPADMAGTSLTAVPDVLELNQNIDFDRGRTNARRCPSLCTQCSQRSIRQRRMRRRHRAKVVQPPVDAHASGNRHVAGNRSVKLTQRRGNVDAVLLP